MVVSISGCELAPIRLSGSHHDLRWFVVHVAASVSLENRKLVTKGAASKAFFIGNGDMLKVNNHGTVECLFALHLLGRVLTIFPGLVNNMEVGIGLCASMGRCA